MIFVGRGGNHRFHRLTRDKLSVFLVDKFLVIACFGWIWAVKCFERFESRGAILGNGEMAEKLPVIIDNIRKEAGQYFDIPEEDVDRASGGFGS